MVYLIRTSSDDDDGVIIKKKISSFPYLNKDNLVITVVNAWTVFKNQMCVVTLRRCHSLREDRDSAAFAVNSCQTGWEDLLHPVCESTHGGLKVQQHEGQTQSADGNWGTWSEHSSCVLAADWPTVTGRDCDAEKWKMMRLMSLNVMWPATPKQSGICSTALKRWDASFLVFFLPFYRNIFVKNFLLHCVQDK